MLTYCLFIDYYLEAGTIRKKNYLIGHLFFKTIESGLGDHIACVSSVPLLSMAKQALQIF